MRLPILALVAIGLCACSQDRAAHRAHDLMRQCYDDLEFNARPFSCEDARKAYHALDMAKVDSKLRVQLRLDEGAIASRMR
jgi:hypothetical protein